MKKYKFLITAAFIIAFISGTVFINRLSGTHNTDPGAPDSSKSDKNKTTYNMNDKLIKTDEEWKKILTEEQFYITRQKGTERAFSGKYYTHKEAGTYVCSACGNELFSSETKYESGSGWPSFYAPVSESSIEENRDLSHGMIRMEVTCSRCDAHLGHVFDDGPKPTNQRYCINSAALDFKKKEK